MGITVLLCVIFTGMFSGLKILIIFLLNLTLAMLGPFSVFEGID